MSLPNLTLLSPPPETLFDAYLPARPCGAPVCVSPFLSRCPLRACLMYPPLTAWPAAACRAQVARVRNCLAAATHRFFQGQGFLYVHAPLITASDCEGAGEMFQVRQDVVRSPTSGLCTTLAGHPPPLSGRPPASHSHF